MASEIENALKDVANKIAQYVKDAAEMNVETRAVEVSSSTDFSQAKPVARTVIKLDGDCEAVVPLTAGAAGLAVDTGLFDVHQRNVTVAIEYRARLLNALLGALQRR